MTRLTSSDAAVQNCESGIERILILWQSLVGACLARVHHAENGAIATIPKRAIYEFARSGYPDYRRLL